MIQDRLAHADAIRTWMSRTPFTQRLVRVCVNLVGAASAAVFSYSFLHFYLETHRPIGIVFSAQQTLVVLAYLIRRPARVVTRRPVDWILAFAGTFIGVLFRPEAEHPAWGVWGGTVLQVSGVAVVAACIVTLGRSFGFAAADRGVVTRGPYAAVRHPMYAAYLLLGSGSLLQSLSVRNVVILVMVTPATPVGRLQRSAYSGRTRSTSSTGDMSTGKSFRGCGDQTHRTAESRKCRSTSRGWTRASPASSRTWSLYWPRSASTRRVQPGRRIRCADRPTDRPE